MGKTGQKHSGRLGVNLPPAFHRSRFLACAFALISGAVSPLAAGMVGDFAPLKAGNKWVFSRTSSVGAPTYWTSETGTRTMIVGTAVSRADTLIYPVSVVDSSLYVYHSTFNGTSESSQDSIRSFTVEVREAANGALQVVMKDADKIYPHDCMLESAFMSHEFADDKAQTDTSTQVPGLVVDTLVGMCPDSVAYRPVNGALKLKQGLGLWTFSGRPTIIHPSTDFSYQLLSFNSATFVGVKAPQRGRGNAKASRAWSQRVGTLLWQGRNLLGRALSPKLYP